MIRNFRTYDLAVQFYRRLPTIQVSGDLKDQLTRAASSIILNLAEGSAKPTKKDRTRYYATAFGSIREVQAVLDIVGADAETLDELDHLAGCAYKLVFKQ